MRLTLAVPSASSGPPFPPHRPPIALGGLEPEGMRPLGQASACGEDPTSLGHQCLSNLQVFSEKLNWGPMDQLREDLKQRREQVTPGCPGHTSSDPENASESDAVRPFPFYPGLGGGGLWMAGLQSLGQIS